MTDRELLERAAKAAGGVSLAWHDGIFQSMEISWGQNDREYWNPLTDDGDAFRLAVKLQIDIQSFSVEGARAYVDRLGKVFGVPCALDGDRAEATRRAIVRAAAAMADDQ